MAYSLCAQKVLWVEPFVLNTFTVMMGSHVMKIKQTNIKDASIDLNRHY